MSTTESLSVNSEKLVKRNLLKDGAFLEQFIASHETDTIPAEICGIIINHLSGMTIPNEKASDIFKKVREHGEVLSRTVGRNVGFRVALLDYVFNIETIMKNPKFVEVDVFEKVVAMSKEDIKLGCYNIHYFKEALCAEIKRAERYGNKLSIMLIDLDNFKEINDHHGHLIGDLVLKDFVAALKDNLRGQDILARYGGDEFLLLLPQTGRIGARRMGERLQKKLQDRLGNLRRGDERIELAFSGGIAVYPQDASDTERLIECADKALYKSKYLGKNRIYDFSWMDGSDDEVSSVEKEKRRYDRYTIISDNSVDILMEQPVSSIRGRIINMSSAGAFIECNCSVSNEMMKNSMSLYLRKLGSEDVGKINLSGNIVRMENEGGSSVKLYIALLFESVLDEKAWDVIRKTGALIPQRH